MKQKLIALSRCLSDFVVFLCALSWGLILIDFGPALWWKIICQDGWRGWLHLGTGALALLALLVAAVAFFIKEPTAATPVEGVHDGA